jgi:hypothetical protein
MKLWAIFLLTGVTLLFMFSEVRAGQPADVNELIASLRDADPNVRMSAFYSLHDVGFATSDSIRVAVINLLVTETAFENDPHSVLPNQGERYSTYVGDVIETVASFHDVRAINALLGVIQSGNMATRALAGFGATSLDAIIARRSSSDAGIRQSVAIALREMLELQSVTDATSLAKIRAALNDLATDADYFVGVAGIRGLLALGGGATALGPVRRIAIDVKPGDYPNAINPRSNGVIPVAVVSSASFDATSIDRTTVRFGPDQAVPLTTSVEDVNSDGLKDLVFHFETQQTGLQCGDTAIVLIGKTTALQQIVGADSVQTVGCK